MGRKVSTRKKKFEQFEQGNIVELYPQQPQKRKTWSEKDLKSIKALNSRQVDFLQGWFDGNNICAHGSAGTGKTFLAVYAALTSLLDPRDHAQRIIIVRSAVSTREIGHLPGTVEEKQAVFEAPYRDIFADIIGRDSTYQDMKDAKKVDFMLTSHVRGLTWDNAVVIVDEAQNMNFHEINSIMTRLGNNSRVLIVGDTKQTDLSRNNDKEGLSVAMRVFERMGEDSDVTIVRFTPQDVVRSGFARRWLLACEDTPGA